MIDVFVGKKDEKIEKQALKLGFDDLLFVKEIKIIKNFDKTDKEKYDCYLLNTANIENLRRMIDIGFNNTQKVIVLGVTNEINRIALEHKKVFALLNPQFERKKDFLDSRDSGLNQVLCKIAKEHGKLILVSVSSLLEPVSLGRAIQNFRLCKKFNTDIQLVNFTDDENEMKSAFELNEIERVLKNKEHFERKF